MKSPRKGGTGLGLLLFDITVEQRAKWHDLPGAVANSGTFDFPVRREVVLGATFDGLANGGDLRLTPHFIETAKKLERQGVRAIAGECGFMAIFQQEISAAVSVPVITSSLIQVPLVYRMLGKNQRVGVLTYNSKSLSEKHFNGVGWSSKDIPISVAGVEQKESWPGRLTAGPFACSILLMNTRGNAWRY